MITRIVAVSMFVPSAAGAETAGTDTAVTEAPAHNTADILFRQGRALLEQGRFSQACAKFEASNRAESSSGTLLNLGTCRAKEGKTASAWRQFRAAADMARQQGRPAHAEEAERQARTLESALCYVTVRLTRTVPGVQLRINGEPIPEAQRTQKQLVDPGLTRVEVRAPGHEPWKHEVQVAEAGLHALMVPALRPTTSSGEQPPPAATAGAGRENAEPERNTAAWIAASAGTAFLSAGAILGALAMSSDADARQRCGNMTSNCPPDALRAEERRDKQALFSTIGVSVGLTGLGVAGYLFIGAESEQPPATSTAAQLDGFQLRFAGRF